MREQKYNPEAVAEVFEQLDMPLRAFKTLAGAAVHALLLVLPAIVVGRSVRLFFDPAIVLFMLAATLFYLAETIATRADRRIFSGRQSREPRRTYVLAALSGGLLLALFWAGLSERIMMGANPLTALQWCGAALLFGGVTLRGAAQFRLGVQFRTECVVADGQPLVQTGIYAWLRHPSESGLLLIAGGACLVLASLASTALLLPFLALALLRIRHEERHLHAAFGEQFLRYQRRVKRFAPLVF